MKLVIKALLAFSIVLAIISPLPSLANTEASETILLDLKNVNVNTDQTYVHEIEAPNNFGASINHTFNVTGNSKAQLANVEHEQTSNKLKLTFRFTDGGERVVRGYKDSDKEQFNQYLGFAVCRYSDGVRWQVNHYGQNNNLIYDIYDFSKQASGSRPYEFYFDRIIAKGKFTADMSVNPAYWVDDKGTTYTAAQIKPGTKTVISSDIEYPNSMNVVKLSYNEKQNQQISPYEFFSFRMVDLYDIGSKYEGTFITPRYVALANEQMSDYATCTQYSFKVFYNFTAKAKASDITGTFTYRYTTSDEPKLMTTITAEPSKIQFSNKDIEVKVTLKAELVNVKQAASVQNFKLYLRTEDNTQNPQPQGYERSGNTLTAEASAIFLIPTSKLNNKSDFTEYFVGRAYAYFTNKQPPNNYLMSDLVKTSTYVYKDKPIDEANHDILAIISGNNPVKVGADTVFSASGSYSKDSMVEGVKWALPNAMIQPSDSYIPGQYSFQTWYDKVGRERALVSIIDTEGRQAWAYMDFDVVEPTIETTISHTGTLKENRKVTFIANNDTPTRYPLSDIKWRVQSLDGTLDQHIRHVAHLTGQPSIDVLFKKTGEYLVTVNTKNTAGYSYEATYVIEVVEDKKPHVDFDFQQKIYRNPNNQNVATFELVDYSYSFDGDYIDKRNWYVIFDANNDGYFNEQAVLFDTGNNREVTYSSSHVGKYKFILEAIEEFGEPTIAEYVTAQDRRRLSTDGW